jgi:hypothetical protein
LFWKNEEEEEENEVEEVEVEVILEEFEERDEKGFSASVRKDGEDEYEKIFVSEENKEEDCGEVEGRDD